ncbi:MAG: MEMO1 family protein [Thermoplasmata archaeon]|nr:MEMO1 family protein [Thermoplasmata archaeon]
MIRRPAVAGAFYPANREKLVEEIERSFVKGFGRIPEVKKGMGKIKGIVVPHAGYIYSGYVAAMAYGEVAENGFAEKFIIIGPNHTGYGSPVALMSHGEWETPLGRVKISEDAKKLVGGIIDDDELAHRYEHSIEVQLPFLQYLGSFEFIPVCLAMQDYETSIEVGEILAEAEDAIIIASTDFSHVSFSKFPSEEDIERNVRERDKMAIEKILALDEKGLIEVVEEENITMCGYGGVAAMLHAVKKRGAKKARLLKYATSYDIEPGTYCVGYAAIVVE